MSELFAFQNLVDAVELLFKIGKEFEVAEQSRRQRIGQWLAELGMLTDSVAMDLEHNIFPFASCSKMEHMVNSFIEVAGATIAPQQRQELFVMLQNAKSIERLVSELKQLDILERDNKLAKLKQIASTLQSAGSVLATK